MIYLGRHASHEASSTKAPDQIRRRDAPRDARPATANRQKGEAESLAEKTALRLNSRMNVLLRLLVPAFEGAVLSFLLLLCHSQLWPEDLTPAQLRALHRADRWIILGFTIFAVIFNLRVNLPLPPSFDY